MQRKLLLLALGVVAMTNSFSAMARAQKTPATKAETPKNVRTLNVAILVYPNADALDIAGPLNVFSTANDIVPRRYNVYTVAANNDLVSVDNGALTIKPRYGIGNSPRADILVVPGGSQATIRQMYDNVRLMKWIKNQAQTSRLTMSVCTGAFLLAKTGLLDNRNATTHWFMVRDFQREFPKTRVYEGARFIEDGKIISTAGVSSGLDGSLRAVEKTSSRSTADVVARVIQYRRATPAFPAMKRARVVLTSPLSTEKTGKLASLVDPVCGMPVDPNTKITAAFGGKTYGFCSEICRDNFAGDPRKYLQSATLSHTSSTRFSKLTPQIVVKDQPLINSMIVVESFTLNTRGWVMAHLNGKGDKPGTMAGVTGPFEAGTYRNVRIKLWGNIRKGDTVWPMLHFDGGQKKGVFEPKDDHHAEVGGRVVTQQITITAVKGVKPQVGNYVVMPPCCMTDGKR